MITSEDIYIEFQKAKMNFYSKPYFSHKIFPPNTPDRWAVRKTGSTRNIRIFDDEQKLKMWIKEHKGKGYRRKKLKGIKMSKIYLETLDKLAKKFITTWSEISPCRYFECGFEIYKKQFHYGLFMNREIMKLYINKDKVKKHNTRLNKKELIKSLMFVEDYIKLNKMTFNKYCMKEYNGYALPVYHYIKNCIDKYFLVFLMRYGYFSLSDKDVPYVPYVVEKYRVIIFQLQEIERFTNKLKRRIENYGTV